MHTWCSVGQSDLFASFHRLQFPHDGFVSAHLPMFSSDDSTNDCCTSWPWNLILFLSFWIVVQNNNFFRDRDREREKELWRISQQLRPWIPIILTITQDLHLWGRTNFGLAHTTQPPGHKTLVVVGPFEEEEEGTGNQRRLIDVAFITS